jgi:ABC-type transport system involved in cytochrome bd biosynthesis fused ATPase/permease subunit
LLCDGSEELTTASLGSITKFGGPIAYLIIYSLVLFAILVWFDSGSSLPRKFIAARGRRRGSDGDTTSVESDVRDETDAVVNSQDPLRVVHVSKSFGGSAKAVDDVSFGVSRDTILALLGPNGAGKTTSFNIIRTSYSLLFAICCPLAENVCRWRRVPGLW